MIFTILSYSRLERKRGDVVFFPDQFFSIRLDGKLSTKWFSDINRARTGHLGRPDDLSITE
jgi:hypothetical protein